MTVSSLRQRIAALDADHAYKSRYPVAYEFEMPGQKARRFYDDVPAGRKYRGAPVETIWDDGGTIWDDGITGWAS